MSPLRQPAQRREKCLQMQVAVSTSPPIAWQETVPKPVHGPSYVPPDRSKRNIRLLTDRALPAKNLRVEGEGQVKRSSSQSPALPLTVEVSTLITPASKPSTFQPSSAPVRRAQLRWRKRGEAIISAAEGYSVPPWQLN